jgi:hypothetical protein
MRRRRLFEEAALKWRENSQRDPELEDYCHLLQGYQRMKYEFLSAVLPVF